MTKTGMPKKRGPSVHSRAARRAISPSLNTDKSLKEITPPPRKTNYYATGAHSAGISKKKGRKESRAQRLRRERGSERAFAVQEQRAVKVDRSKGQAKSIRNRRKEWEDINRARASNGFAALGLEIEVNHAEVKYDVIEGLEDVGENEGEKSGGEKMEMMDLPLRPPASSNVKPVAAVVEEDDEEL